MYISSTITVYMFVWIAEERFRCHDFFCMHNKLLNFQLNVNIDIWRKYIHCIITNQQYRFFLNIHNFINLVATCFRNLKSTLYRAWNAYKKRAWWLTIKESEIFQLGMYSSGTLIKNVQREQIIELGPIRNLAQDKTR